MHCPHCGANLPEGAKFCASCGGMQRRAGITPLSTLRGFSTRINDPAFARYIKSNNRWSAIFSLVLAVAAVVGFYIAGETGADGLKNPDSLHIGFAIGGMFVVIALLQILFRNRGNTWDGAVENKKVQRKTVNEGETDRCYVEYSVVIRRDDGGRHVIRTRSVDLYNYYRVGDRVRRHGRLNSCEKYDKTGDSIIPCVACGGINSLCDDHCAYCKCPLLK